MIANQISKALGRKKYLAAAIPLIMAAQAQSFEFFMGEIEGSLDSQISMGSSWRMEGKDDALIQGQTPGQNNAVNNNDGDLNFEDGDSFSQILKGSHDLQISYQNVGAFVRGKYWYDGTLEESDTVDDENSHDLAKFSGAEVLDAFIYGEFDLLDMPVDVRLGKQVVSWGESTFLHGGINQVNPIDVSSFRRPGAELKEGLIPVNLAFASVGLTDNLSAETFYQLDYQETVTEGCGTYFSTNDFQPEGCNTINTPAGTITRNVDGNRRPDADGQFGIAFRYFSEALDTEFGFYAMNIHGRSPVVSSVKANFAEEVLYPSGALDSSIQGFANQVTSPTGDATDSSGYDALVAAAAVDAGAAAQLAALNSQAAVSVMAALTTDASASTGLAGLITPQSYYTEYPEDQQLMGISFASNVAGIALSGEITHKLDVPVQINAYRSVSAAIQSEGLYQYVFAQAGGDLAGGTEQGNAFADTVARDTVLAQHTSLGLEVLDLEDGAIAPGYKSFDVTQAQMTLISTFDQVLGASSIALVAEAGYTYIHEFNSDIEFGGETDNNGGYDDIVTEGSWGYTSRLIGTYNDVFAGINLSPVLAWSHDVNGVSPGPGGNFIEGEKTLGFALNAEYQNMYTAAISYTQYFGGITNKLADRDYASISLGMQF